jgi:homoserine kinase
MRSTLIPQYDEVKKASLAAGALGGGISGSGPSVFMLSSDVATAHRVEAAIKQVYDKVGIDFHLYITTINPYGVKAIV